MRKIVIFLSVFLFLIATLPYLKVNADETNKIEKVFDSTLTENNVYYMLTLLDIKYPEVVLSQIMLESDHLKSRLCISNNNLLGMTIPYKRETTAINKTGKYAKYATWITCVLDYKLYQDVVLSKHKFKNKNEYIAFLHKNYAKSKTYKTQLTAMSRIYEDKAIINQL